MSNRDWADTPELEDLIVKALANGADEWTLSSKRRTEVFLAEKARQEGATGGGGSTGVATKEDILLIRKDLRLLKAKQQNPRLPRSASETSTVVTPAELDLRVEGRALVNTGIVSSAISNSVEGALKDVQEYYTLLHDHIKHYGGASFDIVIRNKKEVVIKHNPFGSGLQEVVFPYRSSSIKNHWIVFCGFECDCTEYFKWARAENIAEGREGESTPPSSIPV